MARDDELCGHAVFRPRPKHGDVWVEQKTKRCMVVLSVCATPGTVTYDGDVIETDDRNPKISGYYADTNEEFVHTLGGFKAIAVYIPRQETEDDGD